MCHITGGGYPDNLPRVLPENVRAHVELSAWTPLPIFTLIQNAGDVSQDRMYTGRSTWGWGMVLVTAPEDAEALLSDLAAAGEKGRPASARSSPDRAAWTFGDAIGPENPAL